MDESIRIKRRLLEEVLKFSFIAMEKEDGVKYYSTIGGRSVRYREDVEMANAMDKHSPFTKHVFVTDDRMERYIIHLGCEEDRELVFVITERYDRFYIECCFYREAGECFKSMRRVNPPPFYYRHQQWIQGLSMNIERALKETSTYRLPILLGQKEIVNISAKNPPS